jgi:hypothetical protein
MDLNHARLPIPPLRHACDVQRERLDWQQFLVLQRAPFMSNAAASFPALSPDSLLFDASIKGFQRPQRIRNSMVDYTSTPPIPIEHAQEIRRLSHDLSNALEIILQTSYLLGTAELDENAQKWRNMLDGGVQKATEINRRLRDFVRTNS